ncbi:vWA domain-containing protein [Ruminococcus sp.]|uniref:vWA domain-containing protein n=1 Tax=Ruminococcus sp. TaxID=41978 RepID=UPI0025F1D957|nr:vWA domain-containing protein [Ruminococcus sp.]MBQ8966031.1 VWA domain-containing protein [Ruminococcus sp.]
MNFKMKPAMLGIAVVVMGIVIAIIAAVSSGGSKGAKVGKDGKIAEEDINGVLEEGANRVNVTTRKAIKGTVTYEETYAADELPDIDKSYPLLTEPTGRDITVEIFSSPEKAGTGTDGWMLELVKDFNDSNQTVDGKSVGIKLRSVSSGTQVDYIVSGASVPDAISPSAYLWCEMLENQGVKTTVITDRTVGNVAGVLLDQTTYSQLEGKYGTVDIKAVVEATADGSMTTGYTNPFVSTTGLNFLASALSTFDSTNPLSNDAVKGFQTFQDNVPFVAYNTLQMRTAAENGTFDCMMMEYQSYSQDASLTNNYKFIPFGMRHDNPLVAVGDISADKQAALELFAEYCKSSEAKTLARNYGFDQMDEYTGSLENVSGNSWTQMQKLWKKNKNISKPIAAVFVLDTSGSMSGAPLMSLKQSLGNSIKYINSDNYIGVVSYSSYVNVDLEIGKFDINQQSYFMGAVDQLTASGNTATYSAVSQAVLMLRQFMEKEPNVSPMVFLLSDGKSNAGAEMDDVKAAVQGSQIPIYTIGYNADLEELTSISEINEAATINADTDDVIYQLKNLFNANL